MTKIRENGATSGVGVLGTYAYDDRGRRTSLTRGNGTVASYGYDAISRLSQLVENLSGTSHDLTLGFTYNPAGQIAGNTRSNDTYAWTSHYTLNRAYSANGLNRYTAITSSTTPTYDGRGNLTAANGATYGYNSGNMLTTASGGATLSYDPVQRLYETVGGGVTTRMAYDGQSLMAEYNGSNTLLRRYVHGPGIDEHLVWYEGTGTSDRRWLHADERGSIVAVSNASGAVTNVNAYDEYGIPRPTNVGRFQYTGQQWIAELGMYHYRARIYWPTLGRFLQTDPIGFGGGINLYGYVGNDPVNSSDPSGLVDTNCTGSLICPKRDGGGDTPSGLGGGASSVTEFQGFASFIEGGSRGSGSQPGSVGGDDSIIIVTASSFSSFSVGYWPGATFQLSVQNPFATPHEFYVFNIVAMRSQCTQAEVNDGLRRNSVPEQDPSRPIGRIPQTYPIYAPFGIQVGTVSSRLLPNGHVLNQTLPGHIFHNGTVERGIAPIGPFWAVGAHGRGLNYVNVIAAINQAAGPVAFNQLDARLAGYLAQHCTGE